MPMRTLFSENILSPSPTPLAIVKPNPFELSFSSATSQSKSNSYSTSSQSSLEGQAVWLTRYLQEQQRFAAEQDDQTRDEADHRSPRYGDYHQKGIPKVLIMGLSRSGKSSIQHVILKTKSAGETLYLEPTSQIVESATSESFVKLECVEVPSTLPFLSPGYNHEAIFSSAGSIVWVIDIQDENLHSVNKLVTTAVFLMQNYPRIHFEVFVHKTDGLSDDYKNNTFRDVRQNIQDELNDRGYGNRGVAFHQTSIYDASVHEAMSKVVQKLLPQLPAVESLLTKLCSKCSMQKVYLFDTMSRIYLATDASPTFLRDFEVCSEYVDMIVDAKGIYSWRGLAADATAARDDDDDDSDATSDAIGESSITLPGSQNLYMLGREINDYLSLICIMGQGSLPDRRVLIDYNISLAADALKEIFKIA